MKKNNFVVIGGQYYMYYYGATPTLIGAKRLALINEEYWDNWQGWHIPKIYRIEDWKKLFAKSQRTLLQFLSRILFSFG